MFKNYLTVAIRNLKRFKAYSLINILGLAIGMACCIQISFLVQQELTFDSHHQNANHIYRIVQKVKDQAAPYIPAPLAPALLKDFPKVTQAVRIYHREDVLVHTSDKSFYEKITCADPSILNVFTIPFIEGNKQNALQTPNAILITQKMAQKYFNAQNPIGQTLTLQDRTFIITGIIQNAPTNTQLQYDFIAPFQSLKNIRTDLDSWWNSNYITYLQISSAQDAQNLEQNMPNWVKGYIDLSGASGYLENFGLQSLTDIHLYVDGHITFVYVFSAIALFILLIACINFMNLSTARATNRAQEVGLRKVVGAHRSQLIRQFLGESLLMSGAAFIVAIALVEIFQNALPYNTDNMQWTNHGILLLSFVGLALIVGLFAGSYPAFFLSAFQPVDVLKGSTSKGTRGGLLRKGLVTMQFAISITLIIGTSIVQTQLTFFRTKNLGYQTDQILVIDKVHSAMPYIEGATQQRFELLKEKLLTHTAITQATISSAIPSNRGISSYAFRPEGAEKMGGIITYIVDTDFINLMDMTLVAGRNFSPDKSTDIKNAFILNESALKETNWNTPAEAIGKQVRWTGNTGEVIGIVKDFHFNTLKENIRPLLMTQNDVYRQWGETYLLLRVQAQNLPTTLAFIEQTWQEMAPQHPFQSFFLDDDFARLYQNEEQLAQTVGIFATLAIFIACLGLLGLASFTAQQRRKEIGVRKVLGASTANISIMLSKEFATLILFANIIAWPTAYWMMSKWLENFAYRMDHDITLFLFSGLLTLIIALGTVGYQALKAARANPIDALRYE